jgi:prepilin-type N-terminal cleavage/methylation domain-containing protein
LPREVQREVDALRRNQKGFTLIELMIVVAIIAILAAVAIPNFISFKRKASLGAAVANLDTARSALSNYAASQDQWCVLDSTNDYAVFTSNLTDYGLSFPESPAGVKWASFDYVRDAGNCASYTITITAADGTTQFKALTKGVCCVDSPNCVNYAKNIPRCTADFGL